MRPPCSCLALRRLALHQPTPPQTGVNHSPPPPHHFPHSGSRLHLFLHRQDVSRAPRLFFACKIHTFPRVQRFLFAKKTQHLLRRVPARGRKHADFLSMREYPR
jgi:hypothetical protein